MYIENGLKNVTLSADENLIEQARQTARNQHTTLNQLFRDWLTELTSRKSVVREYRALMREIHKSGAMAGRKFTREEMNEGRPFVDTNVDELLYDPDNS
ncbi:MAG: hypothetical protein M3N54_04715 [Acidobacteriota bacterium]|nr:hypothetical protein [Acidobacteriota bacterium]